MNTSDPSILKVGDQVQWTGFLESIMGDRKGTVVEVLANPTMESHFDSYLIRRDDGVEGMYYISQLQRFLSDSTAPQA